MPRRTARPARPGRAINLCQCGTAISESQVACKPCWDRLPLALKAAYLTAKGHAGPALAKSAATIRAHLGQTAGAR